MVPIPSRYGSNVARMVEPMTVAGRSPEPYLHLDNRGLVLFDGAKCVMFAGAMLGWVRETFDLLLDEKRATRHRGDLYLGGMVDDESQTVTLYGGPAEGMATLELGVDTLGAVRDRLHGR
jgi:hypothetical protein